MTTATTAALPKARIASIDILRGAIMIIMALDHVRDFFSLHNPDPTDLHTTTPLLFFTRWITHFCAPCFVFLSGVSAYLSGQRKTKAELGIFLIKRGAWLILIELAVVTLGWTFDPEYHVFVLQVIWAIGWSMIIMGLLIRFAPMLVPVLGVLLVCGHNITDYLSLSGNGWTVALTSNFAFIPIGPNRGFFDLYAVLPWTGMMLLGYSIGRWFGSGYTMVKRRETLLIAGACVTLLFVVLRLANRYGDAQPWSTQATPMLTFLSFLNVSKYPPSLCYTCMTLGPALIVLALTEKASGAITRVLSVYGRVPFFYYILHLYLIHIGCVVLFFATGHTIHEAYGGRHFGFQLYEVGFGLGGVYLVWLFVVALLYFPSRWYDNYKRTHRQWWLSYI